MPTQEELRTKLKLELDVALKGVELHPADDLNLLAQRVAALVRGVPQQLDEALGPFYDASTVSNFMEVAPENIAEHVHAGEMFGMLTDSGALILPTSGFDGEAVAEWVGPIVGTLSESGVDGWTIGLWLAEENTDLAGMTPLEWFESKRNIETVKALARDMAVHWAA